jgi:uncharacterized phosphosugar-binding protein
MKVVALTSLAHAAASRSKHGSGSKLADVADVVLDNGAPAGDAVVRIAGLSAPVSPVSTVGGCALVNLLKAESARLLTEAGKPPSVLTAACHVGEAAAAEIFERTYDEYRRRVGVLYR